MEKGVPIVCMAYVILKDWSWLKITPRFLPNEPEAKEIPTKELSWSDIQKV